MCCVLTRLAVSAGRQACRCWRTVPWTFAPEADAWKRHFLCEGGHALLSATSLEKGEKALGSIRYGRTTNSEARGLRG